jgi:hypothetical protein
LEQTPSVAPEYPAGQGTHNGAATHPEEELSRRTRS